MATQLEVINALERKLALTISLADIEKDVSTRLQKLSREVKMSGFRPGKVPMKMIAQSYGAQVQSEVMGDAVSKAFSSAVEEHKLKVAGQPNVNNGEGAPEGSVAFVATFEVYPEFTVAPASGLEVERATCVVSDAEVDKTLEVLRKQRVNWVDAGRNSQEGDRVTMDFVGTLDGVEFPGGKADDFPFVLGEGRMLPDFETGVKGAPAGETRAFEVRFPEDYGSKDLAGKSARFVVKIKKVEAPNLPELDAEFAKQLGVADGDLSKMRADIRGNLEREVGQRVRSRNKNNVMDSLPALASFELPKSLVSSESEALAERAKADFAQRGMDVKNMPIPPEAFKDSAEKRVRLGLLVSEIVQANKLQAKPDQIRKQIEEFASAYENPAELMRYYFSNKEQLAQVEAIVVEQNVVDWVYGQAKVTDKAVAFDELMAQQ
jgi:trigger factor